MGKITLSRDPLLCKTGKEDNRNAQIMIGGYLMFPKIVSETGICFTKASILSDRYGVLM